MDSSGNHIGKEDYFNSKTGRNIEDYDISIGEMPLGISSEIRVELERQHD